MPPKPPSRRSLLGWALGSLGLSALARPAWAGTLTPPATEGPFYPTPAMRGADIDNDLVKIIGQVQEAGGEVFTLKGQVFDNSGTPLAGLRVEIWQCDLNGKYLHSGDRQDIRFDTGFQGFGHDITDAEGNYRFRTIKPVTYPGRTPHIHVKVFADGVERLTTQFYISGHPANTRDRIFRRLSDTQAAAVSMLFSDHEGTTEATVNITL